MYTPIDETVPHAGPVQPVPATLHKITRLGFELAAGVSVAENIAEAPALTEDGPVNASVNRLAMVIVPLPLLDGSATLVAVNEMAGDALRISGAEYIPEAFTSPQATPEHVLPASDQVTLGLGWPAECTVAANGCVAPSATCMVCGVTETAISLATVTIDADFLEPSTTLAACTEIVAGIGKMAGAVYTPPESIVPTAAFPPGIPFTFQVTELLDEWATVAVNVCLFPSRTDAVAGATVTVMPEGGSCDGPEPASPPQPRNDATKSIAAHQ